MIRGTTPTHTFTLPVEASTLKVIKVIYSQLKKQVVVKTKEDLTLDGEKISVTLTQKETFSFRDDYPCRIRIRALTNDGKVIASNPVEEIVEPSDDEEVLV